MAPLISLVLTALAASFVSAQNLDSCGDAMYDPSQYTCFNDSFLCPILNGDIYLQCGDACYSTTLYSCSNTTLEPFPPSVPDTLEDCGDARFSPYQYVCFDGDFLCPYMEGNATLRCGDSCYAPWQYNCTDGQLAPVPPPPPTCIGLDGTNPVCNDIACEFYACCPGLINIADKCRDPCDITPSACTTTTTPSVTPTQSTS
ncbi:carbohydrate binding-domain-containing protein [Rhodocollybia butyracea]|uniref:Carbohydrate binding-domain-containing protein n=1 Tax=Rhodocollybia butyracea TaxID=206335 RepID=A0A9P5PKR2_9AGAR|nr:carbohydrate binding-domain-containing protein [Rhodocollybia butyracea]